MKRLSRTRSRTTSKQPHYDESLLLAHRDAWHDAATAVEATANRWRDAIADERAREARAFFAALEREEAAAHAYQLACEA
jgi:hypothetical protein